MRTHIAEECKNDYAAQLQKYNKEQNQFYFTDMPLIFNVRSKCLSPNMSRRICSFQLTVGMIPSSLAECILISVCMIVHCRSCKRWMNGVSKRWRRATFCLQTRSVRSCPSLGSVWRALTELAQMSTRGM